MITQMIWLDFIDSSLNNFSNLLRIEFKHSTNKVGSSHGVMVKVMDCSHKVSEFKLQSSYYIHFQKSIEPPHTHLFS